MAVLNVNKLTMEFGQNRLFTDVSFDVYENDKIGFIGVNGAGKTTLFKLITKEYSPAEGDIFTGKNTTVGYMEQHTLKHSDNTVYEEALSVFGNLIQLEKEIESLNDRIDKSPEDSEKLIEKQTALHDEYIDKGGLVFRSRTASALTGLGFTKEEFDKKAEVLSGGQKSKLGLCKLLLSGADFLLLDEPTNHLDIKSVNWLENFLNEFRGSFIVISHDRYFLDKVTNKTMEMENGRLFFVNGSYSKLQKLKKEKAEYEKKVHDAQVKEIKRIENMIDLQKQFGQERNYKTIAHKQKSIDRIKSEMHELEKEPEEFSFKLDTEMKSGEDVLKAEGLTKGFGGRTLYSNVNIDLKRGERVFIIGENGCGKTTLLKQILENAESENENTRVGANVKIGYFDQSLMLLDEKKTALDEIWDANLKMTQTQVRTALGRFLFKGDDVFKTVGSLSGGEKARLSILKLMLEGSNLLIMDEPTNHLDINSREALENALEDYEGTMLVVSHDRFFINRLANAILYFKNGEVHYMKGNYDAYNEKYGEEINQQENRKEKATAENNEYKFKKQRNSEINRLKGKIRRCEESIAEAEAKKEELERLLGKENVASSYTKVCEITEEIGGLEEELKEYYDNWEKLQTILTNLSVND